MGAAVTSAPITSAVWALKVGSNPADNTIGQVREGVAAVHQCIRIVCTTPQGSDPLRPTFAWDMLSVIDLPVTLAIPLIVAGLAAAIAKWEPRAQVISITATPVNPSVDLGSHWDITVVWQLILGAQLSPAQTTIATIPRNA
jgi:uncharacterized protein